MKHGGANPNYDSDTTMGYHEDIMKHIMEYYFFNPPVLIKHIPEKTMAHGFLGVRTSRKMPREQDDDFYWNLAFLSYTFNTNAT